MSELTVGDVKIAFYEERLAQQEQRHSREIVDLRVQHLIENQELRNEINRLNNELNQRHGQEDNNGTADDKGSSGSPQAEREGSDSEAVG